MLNVVPSVTYPLSSGRLRGLAVDLAGPAEAAALALTRLDERLACVEAQLAEGVRARAHLLEAQALAGLAGELVGLEELVLHDAGMDSRAPGAGTVRAARILAERRSLAGRAPDAALAPRTVRRLAGVAAAALEDAEEARQDEAGEPADDPADEGLAEAFGASPEAAGLDLAPVDLAPVDLAPVDFAAIDRLIARTRRPLAIQPREAGSPEVRLRDPGYAAAARVELWLGTLEAGRALPGALAAALALDAWLALEPAERGGEGGWALASTVLRRRGLAAHHLPALALAYRRGRFRWSPHPPLERRLEGLLAAVAESARLAQADLRRLALARELMLRKCAGRRETSRLPELVGLFVALPLVTVALAARRLRVSPQAIEAMLKELGPSLPRELTGRKRYRAWGIV